MRCHKAGCMDIGEAYQVCGAGGVKVCLCARHVQALDRQILDMVEYRAYANASDELRVHIQALASGRCEFSERNMARLRSCRFEEIETARALHDWVLGWLAERNGDSA